MSPSIKPEVKKWGDMAYYIPPPEMWGGHVPRVPHQMALMVVARATSFRLGSSVSWAAADLQFDHQQRNGRRTVVWYHCRPNRL